MESHIASCTAQVSELNVALNRDQGALEVLREEVELLRELKGMEAFRECLVKQLGEQRLRSLADGEFVKAHQRRRERADALMDGIKAGLEELEELLGENLKLTDEEWEAVVTASKA